MKQVGIEALLTLIVQFGFIWMTFKCIQGIHVERFFFVRHRKDSQC